MLSTKGPSQVYSMGPLTMGPITDMLWIQLSFLLNEEHLVLIFYFYFAFDYWCDQQNDRHWSMQRVH